MCVRESVCLQSVAKPIVILWLSLPLSSVKNITITMAIITMTISSTNAEASAGPNIKRQSSSLAGTNSGLWSGRGGSECEKVNSKNGTIRFVTYKEYPQRDKWLDGGHIYMQTDRAELGNVTASSQLCPSHSFPVNVSRTQQSWGSPSDRLCTCYISSDRNNLLPAQALQAAWDLKAKRESTEKGTEGKKKKRFSEQMQVSRK